jgi:hypothetical protein
MKTYLRFGKPTVRPTESKFVGELRYAYEWVHKLEDGTVEYRDAAEETQKCLMDESNLETTLVEISDAHQLISKWVICKEEPALK